MTKAKSLTLKSTLGATLIGAATFATMTLAYTPSSPECIAPANAGGGWDFTCRAVGKSLEDQGLIDTPMAVENMPGGGGGLAFGEVVANRGSDSDLIVAASSATATRLAQGAYPGHSMDQVRWLSAIGADYGVIAVAADSEIKNLPELLDMIKADPAAVKVGGGSSAGGWDHLKVLIALFAHGMMDVAEVQYEAFDGGGEAVDQLLAGEVIAFTGDVSEAKRFVDQGDIRVLAILSHDRLPGEFADFPTAKEQGVDAIGANWRGFYAPAGMSDEAYNAWVSKISDMYASDAWKEVMAANGLAPLELQGAEFEEFVAESVDQIQTISQMIGIID